MAGGRGERREKITSASFTYKLAKALRHATREHAAIAADILGMRADPRTIAALIWAVKHCEDSLVRSSAVRALARFRDRRAQVTVMEATADRDALVRKTARDVVGSALRNR